KIRNGFYTISTDCFIYKSCISELNPPLPQTADDANITAKYTHGVLEISIPKKEIAAEKKIEITVEG
ncbi:Hsp20/alpha crystallin family protein, partial [Legionella bozemanae]